jgi:hypothetical protein
MEVAEVLTAAGLAGAALSAAGTSERNRIGLLAAGAALVAASALTRFGVFEAGRASARDPRYTVRPQRKRLRDRLRASGRAGQTV